MSHNWAKLQNIPAERGLIAITEEVRHTDTAPRCSCALGL